VRETTEQRLRRLRVQLMTLRSQEKSLEDRVKNYEEVHSQVREALMRIDRRKTSTEDTIDTLYAKLRQFHRFLREAEMAEVDEEMATATVAQEA
jgi:septal ring factor EnvC (AmiA/AmiB activator)